MPISYYVLLLGFIAVSYIFKYFFNKDISFNNSLLYLTFSVHVGEGRTEKICHKELTIF